jgi:alpha-ketoglutarate-dependent taurine dioxygenase
VFKDQQNLSPKSQYELTKRFDPASERYGHKESASNIIHQNFQAIPDQPQVQVKGNGFIKSFMGLENIKLRHPHHGYAHRERISEDQDDKYTRFNRWHIDAALYDLNPPKVTTLMAVEVPKGRRQTILYDDGSGEELDAPLATTAFISGQNMFNILSPEDQEFVRTSKVEYAAHPYVHLAL